MEAWFIKLPWNKITLAADKHGLNPWIVASVVMVESSGDEFATRFEPRWKYLLDTDVWAKRLGITEETERILQKVSWGPMQVMGSVAREHGFKDPLPKLCSWWHGMDIGCKHLAKFMKTYKGDIWAAVSAYNAGHATPDNAAYVNKVRDRFREVYYVPPNA